MEVMECFRSNKCAATATVFVFLLLLLAFGEARVLSGGGSGDPPPSSSDKLLNTTATAAAPAKEKQDAMEDRKIAASGECSEEAVVVSQRNEGPMPDGIPSYTVTITNTCLGCTVRNVHVACGEFASTELVSPSDFRRLAVGDCLVGNGAAMGPGDTITFEYSNSFQYDMDVASVTCG